MRSHKIFWPDPFSRFDFYGIRTDRQTDRQTDNLISDITYFLLRNGDKNNFIRNQYFYTSSHFQELGEIIFDDPGEINEK